MSQSEEEIQALIKANEAEEQIILGQAMFQESSNEVEQMRQNAEMAIMEIEIRKLEKEYEEAVKEMAQINDAELAKEEQALDTELQGLMTSAQQTDLEYDAAMKKYEQELAAYNAEIAAYEAKEKERRILLEDAKELMVLGLISSDYSKNDDALIASIQSIRAERQREEDFAVGNDNIPLAATLEKKHTVWKYNAFLKAHTNFSIKYKRDIENWAGYEIDGVDIRKVGEFYMPFGLRHVLDVMDPARMGGIVRPYWRLKPNSEGKKKGGDVPFISFSWNGKEWTQDSEDWKERWEGNFIGKERDRIYFAMNGNWGNSFLPGESKRYEYAGFLEQFDKGFSEDFSDIPFGDFTLPKYYKVRDYMATHTERYVFERCPPGYWFKRGIPEETSQCVYMGDSMVDYKESFYPRYATPKLQPGPIDENEYLLIKYENGQRIAPDTTLRKMEERAPQPAAPQQNFDSIILFRREELTQAQIDSGGNDVMRARAMGYNARDIEQAMATNTFLAPRVKPQEGTRTVKIGRGEMLENIREAEAYKVNQSDNVVVRGNQVTTEGVIAQNTAAGGVMD